MCGIAGALGPGDGRLVETMVRALAHRGPDGGGVHHAGDLHIGATRLAVLDIASGDQPMGDGRGRSIVYNGEIYNHRELRDELRGRGHVFATRSDTEVVLRLYIEYGARAVEKLRGMYAFAIADGERLLIARDPLGIKPLYYTREAGGGRFLFASEIKALLCCPAVPATLDERAFADSLLLGHPVGRRTLFAGIQSVAPGSVLEVSSVGEAVTVTERLFPRSVPSPDEDATIEEGEQRLGEVLVDTVERHLSADVEVAVHLSGGLDSSVLAAIACRARPVRLFTVADGPDYADAAQARRLADALGAPLTVALSSESDALAALPECIWAAEQPLGVSTAPFYLLCKSLGGEVKVCLNGEGADEVFGGYPEYLDRAPLADSLTRGCEALRRTGLAASDEALTVLDALAAPAAFDGYLTRLFDWNQRDPLAHQHLGPLDKLAMASGVECRVPYLDRAVLEVADALPMHCKVDAALGIQKHVLRRFALRDERLWASVLRQKLGLPSAGWRADTRFAAVCDRQLPDDYLVRHPYGAAFDRRCDLLGFELFEEVHLRGRGARPAFDLQSFIADRR